MNKLLGISVFIISLFSVSAQSKQQVINWQTFHVPPMYMKTGDFQGQGFIDKVLDLIIQELPDYEHRKPLTTLARAIYDIQLGKNNCHPALYKTPEREAFVNYSLPSLVSPSNRFVALPELLEKNQLVDSINLVDMMANSELIIALIRGRSYGDLDQQIALAGDDNILRMSLEKSETLFMLISKRRIDGAIAYPFEANFYNQMNQPKFKLSTMPIEGSQQFAVGYVACPKNEWGETAISQINLALSKIVGTEAFLQAMTTWWEDERLRPEFIRFYQDNLLSKYESFGSKP